MSGRRIPIGLFLIILALALLGAMAGSIFWGRALSVANVLTYFTRGFSGQAPAAMVQNILDLALPRILLAAITGAGLAWSGALFQALFRNPLADPYFLGVSAGASFGSTLVLVLTGGAVGVWLGLSLSSLSAFGFALAAVLAVYFIVSALMLLSSERLDRIVLATMGSFARASWEKAALAWPALLLAMIVSFFFSRDLNLILLGEERAFGLGVAVEKRKRIVLGLASLMAALCVASSGIIWFVGLIVPHLVRLAAGPDHRRLLPASALAGAILLVVADALSRTLVPPYEIPIGILTALLGAPFFIYLIRRNRKSAAGGTDA
jgi:iron complex transport system permease protein